jgi:hypothetical protein
MTDFLFPALHRFLMGLFRSVASLTTIAFELMANRGFMHTDTVGDPSLRMANFFNA